MGGEKWGWAIFFLHDIFFEPKALLDIGFADMGLHNFFCTENNKKLIEWAHTFLYIQLQEHYTYQA